MHIFMRSIFNLRLLRNMGRARVFVIIDEAICRDGAEYMRVLRPWRTWLTIDGLIVVGTPLEQESLGHLVSPACQAVVVVSESEQLVSSVCQQATAMGLVCIDGSYPLYPDRSVAMMQEVSHHDFELGGLNEWDGQPTQFGQYVLQHLSRTHCERIFPRYALPEILRLFQEHRREPINAIDIGCGPISRLRWGALQGWLSITGVDPLLDMYKIILERHGLMNLPKISCSRELSIRAEELSGHIARGSYDFAYSCNAIDHCEDPPLIMSQVAACLSQEGVFSLQVYPREGTRQGWTQLHQYDIYFGSDSQLVCQSRDGAIRALTGEETGFAIRETVVNDESQIVVLLERRRERG
jgi:SAM-dependent methyltransferase